MSHILSFDIEDWFHLLDIPTLADPTSWDSFESRVEKVTLSILDELRIRNLKATFYVLGWIADRYPDLINEIANQGHEIGTHSYSHSLVYNMTKKEFESDLMRSVDTLSNICGRRIESYRAPGFSIKREQVWIFETLSNAGISVDSSIFAARRAHGGIDQKVFCKPFKIITSSNRAIYELPVVPGNIFNVNIPYSGGGYFRLLNRTILAYLNSQADYSMWYFHPRDFDVRQPRLSGLTAMRHFRTYVGLKNSFEKFRFLLDKFDFVSADEFVKQNQCTMPIYTTAKIKEKLNA